ncbi:MAG: hypothetical protein ACQETP_09035 [Bacteroidota bacterium]
MLHVPAPPTAMCGWTHLVVVFCIVMGGPSAPFASAQEIGIGVGGTQAGYDDVLDQPTGPGGYVDLPVGQRFAVRFMVLNHTEERSITRSPCTGLVPPEADCTPEPFSVDARLTTYGVGTALRLTAPGATVQPKLYFLITSPSVDVSINAENSDRTLNPIDPGSTNLGIALGGEVHYPITDIIALSAQIGLQRPKFGTCADDGFDPFCQTRTLVQGALGMQFRIPGSIPE